MVRITGVDLPRDKRAAVLLTYIYGTNHSISEKILVKIGISEDICVRDSIEDQVNVIHNETDDAKAEDGLCREVWLNIRRPMGIGCYRGIRHRRGLPIRGQRTRTNACTRKGPVRTVVNKKKQDDRRK